MGLGSAEKGAVTLAEAREAARIHKKAIAKWDRPIVARQESDPSHIPLFGIFADEFVENQAVGFRNAKHIAQWKMTLTNYAASILNKSVDQISTDDVLGILQPIWQT